MKNVFYGLLVAAMTLAVTIVIGCWLLKAYDPPKQPWLVCESNHGREIDQQALVTLLLHRTSCGISFCGDTYIVNIKNNSDRKPRSELEEIVEEIRKNLPEGCPYVIRIETVEHAVSCLRANIANLEEQIIEVVEDGNK